MNIKIIGSDCSNGIKLKKEVLKAVKSIKGKTEIELLDDYSYILKYNIVNKPALIINGKTVSQGKVLNVKEVLHYAKLLA